MRALTLECGWRLAVLALGSSVPVAGAEDLSQWRVFARGRDLTPRERACAWIPGTTTLLSAVNERMVIKRVPNPLVPAKTVRAWRVSPLLMGFRRENVSSALEAFGGTLVGIDGGEWGGQLLWVPSNARRPQEIVTLAEGNTVGIVNAGMNVYALIGTAHMEWNSGAILRVRGDHAVPRAETWLTLDAFGGRPLAYLPTDQGLIVATVKGVFSLEDRELRVVQHVDLSSMMVRSIARDRAGVLALASGRIIAKIDEREPDPLTWLASKACVEKGWRGCGCEDPPMPVEVKPRVRSD